MRNSNDRPTIVIFGSNSSFGVELASRLASTSDILTVSRSESFNSVEHFKVNEYSEAEIIQICNSLKDNSSREISVLILNGVSDASALYRMSESEVEGVIEVNLKIPIRITRVFIRELSLKELTFFYFSSSRALAADKGISVYSATKSGMVNFTKCCAAEYGRLKKYFFLISFGLYDGGLYKSLSSATQVSLKSRTSVPGFVDMDKLSKIIIFNMSNSASTGSILKLDNGFL